MPRDPRATPIQGPDNGTGNPIPVGIPGVGLQDVNLLQVQGAAILTEIAGLMRIASDLRRLNGTALVPAAAGVPRVGIAGSANEAVDGSNIRYIFDASTGNVDCLDNRQPGWNGFVIFALANVVAQQVIPISAGLSVYLGYLTWSYFGANGPVDLTVFDGTGNIWGTTVEGTANRPNHVTFPDGGIRGQVGSTLTVNLPAGGAGTFARLAGGFRYAR